VCETAICVCMCVGSCISIRVCACTCVLLLTAHSFAHTQSGEEFEEIKDKMEQLLIKAAEVCI